jgi:tetratricopeptide (TPR) repeat protein
MNQTRTGKDWDLKLAAVLFIGTCATMSLILPNWPSSPQAGAAQDAAPAPRPASASAPAAFNDVPAPLSPAQRQAAQADYRTGMEALHQGRYDAAATQFKKALEKSPELAEAYVGLGDAFLHLQDYQAAQSNARHALTQLKPLGVDQAPDPALNQELAYAHRVLGMALLHLARDALNRQDATTGRMQALEASSHCNLAMVFDNRDQAAHDCVRQAKTLIPPG